MFIKRYFSKKVMIKLDEKQIDEYMESCIILALKGRDAGIKRPYVGALVLSKRGEVVGRGYKHLIDFTELSVHAERMALQEAEELSRGGTLITTLEPCLRTHPHSIFRSCSKLIEESGIARVIFGCFDVKLKGVGVNYLRERRIEIIKYEGRLLENLSHLGMNYLHERKKLFHSLY